MININSRVFKLIIITMLFVAFLPSQASAAYVSIYVTENGVTGNSVDILRGSTSSTVTYFANANATHGVDTTYSVSNYWWQYVPIVSTGSYLNKTYCNYVGNLITGAPLYPYQHNASTCSAYYFEFNSEANRWFISAYKVGNNWNINTKAGSVQGYSYLITPNNTNKYATYTTAGTWNNYTLSQSDMIASGGRGTWTAAIFDANDLSQSKAFFQFIVSDTYLTITSVPSGANVYKSTEFIGNTPTGMYTNGVADIALFFTLTGYEGQTISGHYTTDTTVNANMIPVATPTPTPTPGPTVNPTPTPGTTPGITPNITVNPTPTPAINYNIGALINNGNLDVHTCAGINRGYFYMLGPLNPQQQKYGTYVNEYSCTDFSIPISDMITSGGSGIWTLSVFDESDMSASKAMFQVNITSGVTLLFTSTPSGANVYINSSLKGVTPFNYNPGTQTDFHFKFNKSGYVDAIFDARYTLSNTVNANLVPVPGSTPRITPIGNPGTQPGAQPTDASDALVLFAGRTTDAGYSTWEKFMNTLSDGTRIFVSIAIVIGLIIYGYIKTKDTQISAFIGGAGYILVSATGLLPKIYALIGFGILALIAVISFMLRRRD